MTKADGTKLILLGVDDGNVKRLTEGKPISVQGDMLGIPGIEIAIVHGKTYQNILDELKKSGVEIPIDRVPEVQPGQAIVFKKP